MNEIASAFLHVCAGAAALFVGAALIGAGVHAGRLFAAHVFGPIRIATIKTVTRITRPADDEVAQ